MMHQPVCVPCEVEYRCVKNEVVVVDHADGEEAQAWFADKWGCPTCGHEIVIGFAQGPFAVSFIKGDKLAFPGHLVRINSFQNQEQRAKAQAVAS